MRVRHNEQLRLILGVAIAWLLVTGQKCSKDDLVRYGEQLCGKGGRLVAKPDGSVACASAGPVTTTTTTSTLPPSTTTTTLPTATPTPWPIPPVAPTPQPAPPCVPEAPMPFGPVSVTDGFPRSSCANPGEGGRCTRSANPEVLWEEGEDSCYPMADRAGANKHFGWWAEEQIAGKVLLCLSREQGGDAQRDEHGCLDAYGRWYGFDGVERIARDAAGVHKHSGWRHGICPAAAPKTCAPAPAPTPGTPATGPGSCSLPPMPECGRSEGPTGVYGCCITDKARPLPASPFDAVVGEEQSAVARAHPEFFDRDGRVSEDLYVDELVRRLKARGFCVTRGGPSDEVGLKFNNSESFQYDVHLGNGRPRLSGYTAYCSPAKFDD